MKIPKSRVQHQEKHIMDYFSFHISLKEKEKSPKP
jgi:hypothetical protein